MLCIVKGGKCLLFSDGLSGATDVKSSIKMDSIFGRKYKLISSENLEEYLKQIGVGVVSPRLVTSMSAITQLTNNEDGSYTLGFITPLRNVNIKFKFGEEFIEERADGVKVKSMMYLDGNSLVQTQVEGNGRKSTHVRVFTHDKLVLASHVDGWDGKCVRTYELVI